MKPRRLNGVLLLLTAILLCISSAVGQEPAAPAPAPKAPAPPTPAKVPAPQKAIPGHIVTLAKLGDAETSDIYEALVRKAVFELSYSLAPALDKSLTQGLERFHMLAREVGKEKRTLMLGLNLYPSRDNEIVLWGRALSEGAAAGANPDVSTLKAAAEAAAARAAASPKDYTPRQLEKAFFQLSNIQAATALEILASLGYSTGKPQARILFANLPLICPVPSTATASAVPADLTTFSTLPQPTTAAPQHRLMILYHPSQREDCAEIKRLLEEQIDVAARQVLIEAMVIELSEDAQKEVGVQWEWSKGPDLETADFKEGTIAGATHQFFELVLNDYATSPIAKKAKVTFRAMLADGKVNILSSPSVLALDNRQARISVVREEPYSTTVIVAEQTGELKILYKTVGITLNIKPRISQDGSAVTMQIQTEVSEIPEMLDFVPSEDRTATAPRVFRRIIQTIARVKNNTPFIIGGLIRKQDSVVVERFPILSKIPILGALFRSKSSTHERREVIIGLTPRVIEPKGSHRPILPKDSARFDFLDSKLFRNSYRLKAQDVFDLGFIKDNEEVLETFRKALGFAQQHPEHSDRPPFDALGKDKLPGEEAIVIRMLYEIAGRLHLEDAVRASNLIYFKAAPDSPAGFDVAWLKSKLQGLARKGKIEKFFSAQYPKRVLVLRYDLKTGGELNGALSSPVATAETPMVASREEAKELWYNLNKLDDYHPHQAAILIDTEKDLKRLRLAVVLREIAKVNNIENLLCLKDFQVGRRIVIPTIEENQKRVFLIDHTVARYMYQSDFYYADFKEKLTRYYEGIKQFFAERED